MLQAHDNVEAVTVIADLLAMLLKCFWPPAVGGDMGAGEKNPL